MFFTTDDISLIFKALRFSAEKHCSQRRKDRNASPYINHPIHVAETLWEIGQVRDVVTIVAAFLHDTLEDTHTTPEEISALFGTEVLTVVQEVTDDKTLPKVQRKRLQIEHASRHSQRAKEIKLADKICNIHDITHSPPNYWSTTRRQDYLDWTEAVVKGLRGVNPYLEACYDELLARARQSLSSVEKKQTVLRVDDRVRHPKRPEWGIGKILECTPNQGVQVFFVLGGQKRLRLENTQLVRLEGTDAKHPLLDNLKPIATRQMLRYKSLPALIERFLGVFQEGFYSNTYINHHRTVLQQAHDYLQATLNETVFNQLLTANQYSEIRERLLEAIDQTSLISYADRLSVRERLQSPVEQHRFIKNLYTLLFGSQSIDQRFSVFVDCLSEWGIAKWPIATYFQFMLHPQSDLLLTSEVTLATTDLCAFDIHYVEQPNWNTYQHLLRFAGYLRNELVDLKPRDMFDLYAFMSIISQNQ